jgi:hypothetical protein
MLYSNMSPMARLFSDTFGNLLWTLQMSILDARERVTGDDALWTITAEGDHIGRAFRDAELAYDEVCAVWAPTPPTPRGCVDCGADVRDPSGNLCGACTEDAVLGALEERDHRRGLGC